jgi:hypothetical protein
MRPRFETGVFWQLFLVLYEGTCKLTASACDMKSTDDRGAITRRTHGLQIKVQKRKKNDFLYIKVLIEGRSESFTCKIYKSYNSNGGALFLLVIS